MDPEVAMEQYIALLSDKVPGWMEGKPSVSISLRRTVWFSYISNDLKSVSENEWLMHLLGCNSFDREMIMQTLQDLEYLLLHIAI